MLYAAALLGVSTSLNSSPEERKISNATAAWRWGLGDGDACTVLPNMKRRVDNPMEDVKCEKIYTKLRDLSGSSDSSKEREKLENSKERLHCDVSQVRAYLAKAIENGSKLIIGGLSNLPSTEDLVLALVDARKNGGLESAYNFHKDRSNTKDSTGTKSNRQSSSQGYHRNPFFANGGGFAQTLDEQAETAFILNQFVNANFLPSSSETAAELALIVGTTAYVLLVLYLCAGAFRVYNKTSSNRAGPTVARIKRTDRVWAPPPRRISAIESVFAHHGNVTIYCWMDDGEKTGKVSVRFAQTDDFFCARDAVIIRRRNHAFD